MDIVAFFQQSAGRWSSIKSNHHVSTTQQQSGRSTIEMELLETADPAVMQLCHQQGVNPAQVTCAARVKWDGTMEGETKQDVGSSLLVAAGEPTQGQLWRAIGNFSAPALAGTYRVGAGGEMILAIGDQQVRSVERIWYESDNVRMRHTKVEQADGKSVVSFCSEVRLIASKPPAA
jgi:hypothetical protein